MSPIWKRRRLSRTPGVHDGFVMMFTLIAVALGGYVMIESSPDFSNYAVLIRSQQFDRNVARIRQAISSRRSYLSTADNNPPDQVLVPQEIRAAVENMVLPNGATTDSTAISMGTTPADPFVPSREWGEVFWGASYNFVRNPAFYDPARKEARDPTAVQIFYLTEDTDDNTNLVRASRTGQGAQSIVSPNPGAAVGTNRFRHITRSKDGERLLSQTTLLTSIQDRYDASSFDLSGANRGYSTDMFSESGTPPVTHSIDYPEWSPNADRIAFRKDLNMDLGAGSDPSPDPNYFMVVKSPELLGVPVDPIAENRTSAGVQFPRFINMGRPHWSPDGRFFAFWVVDAVNAPDTYILTYDWERRQWHIPRQDGNGGVSNYLIDATRCRDGGTPISWRPDSNGFVYVDELGDIVFTMDIRSGATAYTRKNVTGAPAGHGNNTHQLIWAPPIVVPEGAQNEVFFYLVDSPPGGPANIVRRRIGDPINEFIQLTDVAWTPGPTEHRLFDISPGGTEVIYMEDDQRKVHMIGIDGNNERTVIDITAGTDDLLEVGFLSARTDWVYPDAGVKKLTQADLTSFDHQGWREFTNRESLFPGDTRFGKGYLRVEPPPNEGQFLWDNGEDIFRIGLDDPTTTVRDPSGNPEPKVIGKMEPTWGWRGINYIGRESGDITGGLPADIFKQVIGNIGSGTTVLVTTGSSPAYGPDNELLALSKSMSTPQTFPPDTSGWPVRDMDIWVVESNGGPVPPPTDLTPDTTDTIESHPDWSPDGRFVYFQREFQTVSRFLGNHTAGIYRTTRFGGSITQVVGEASITPAWNNGYYVSGLEFYEPSVSPDGTRLAFIARERLLGLGSLAGTVDTTRVGEVVGEAVYVKDLLFNTAPTCLLRSIDSEIGAAMPGGADANAYLPLTNDGTQTTGNPADHTDLNAYADHGFHRPTWSPDGQLIYVNRTFPRNRWFPKKGINRTGNVGPAALRNSSYRDFLEKSQIIRIKATHPWHVAGNAADGVHVLPDNSWDPPADNFDVVVQNVNDFLDYEVNPRGSGQGPVFDWATAGLGAAPASQRQILNATASRGAYVFQRVLQDVPAAQLAGMSIGTDYVLSGYVRSQGGLSGLHSAQIMCFLLNNQGLFVDLTSPGADVFQIGLADVGGEHWTRFSAGIRFDPTQLKDNGMNWGDNPPYSVLLALYSLGGVGATAEFTGIKMEKAFDTNSLAPTVFSPGWVLHSSSLRPDPSRPNSFIFER